MSIVKFVLVLIEGSQERWHSVRYTEEAVAPWPGGGGGKGGPWPPLLLRPVGKLPMLSEIVGNCQGCRKLSKLSTGGGGVKDLKCCRPENFLVCRKKISVCRKSTALGPPPKKKHMGPMAPLYIHNRSS